MRLFGFSSFKMAAPIQKVASTAYKLFTRLNPVSGNFKESAKDLIQLVNKITSSDLNFKLVSKKNKKSSLFESAPCSYVHIWEDNVMSMGIFVVGHGASIPLHNHPRMNGICKVIHGTVKLRSFTSLEDSKHEGSLSTFFKTKSKIPEDDVIPAVIEEDKLVRSCDDCCILTHDKGNIHEIFSVEGPAAFLDILAPPYDHETYTRVCQYYEHLPQPDLDRFPDLFWLAKVSSPNDFWCDEIHYSGPKIIL